MRTATQIVVGILLCVLGVCFARWVGTPSAPVADMGLWQEGVWELQTGIGRRVVAALGEAGESSAVPRISVSVSAGSDCRWDFASLTGAELARFLTGYCATAGKPGARVMPADGNEADSSFDLKVRLDITELPQTETGEELHCTLTLGRPGQPEATSTLRALCPPGHRGWFVRPRAVPAVYLILAGVLGLAGVLLLGLGAWQAFVREYAGSSRMWAGVATLMAGAGFLLAAWIAAPATRTVSIPAQQLDVVVETSDAVLFPMASGPNDRNPLALFLETAIAHLRREMTGGRLQGRDLSFWRWIVSELAKPLAGAGEGETIQLSLASDVRVYRTVPGQRSEAGVEYLPPVDLPKALACGRLGRESGFVLPWQIPAPESVSPRRLARLVVALMSADAGSADEAEQWDRALDQLRRDRPKTTRVFAALLPSVPRSAASFEFEEERLRRLSRVSDWLVCLNGAGTLPAGDPNQCQAVPSIPLVTCPSLSVKSRADWSAPTDLDARRTELFGAIEQDRVDQSAEALAKQVSQRVVWQQVPVFRLNRVVVWAIPALAGLLLLFLSLQDELAVLEFRAGIHRGQLVGRLLVLGIGLLGTLYVLHSLCDASVWAAQGSIGLVVWGLLWWWYCTLWLPYVVGRGAGVLPPPQERLRMRRLFWLLAGAAAALLAGLMAGVTARLGTGRPLGLSWEGGVGGVACLSLLLASAGLLLFLNAWFLWNRFARGGRRGIVLVGAALGALLLAWPWWDSRLPGHVLDAVLAWLGALVLLDLTRRVLRGQALERETGKTPVGWRWLAFLLLAVPGLMAFVRGPVLATSGNRGAEAVIGPVASWLTAYWMTCLLWVMAGLVLTLALSPRILREFGWWRGDPRRMRTAFPRSHRYAG